MKIFAIAGFASLVLLTSPNSVSAQDVAEMAKWASATLLHWHLVGEFTGEAAMIQVAERPVMIKVTDRLEIDFDYDNIKVVGQPVIKNFPNKHSPPEEWPNCPAMKINGTFEFFTAQSIEVLGIMQLHGKQDRPAGSVPKVDVNQLKPCGSLGWEDVAAVSPTVNMTVQLPQPMMLAMPSAPGFEMEISKDHKSFIQKLNTDGWVWTMTPAVVK
jgi:hypothetical protein